MNKQNKRILATSKQCLSPDAFRTYRTQKPASVMIWAGATSTGRTPLVFIPHGVKINQEVYRETILEKVVKPWAHEHFKQDSAPPAHKAKMTQVVQEEFSRVYFICWATLFHRFEPVGLFHFSKRYASKHELTREWGKIPENHVRTSVDTLFHLKAIFE